MWHDWVNYIAPNEFILAIMKVIKMNCIQESFALSTKLSRTKVLLAQALMSPRIGKICPLLGICKLDGAVKFRIDS